MDNKINSDIRNRDDRTVLMILNEISKIFDDKISKCPENVFFNEKTARLIIMILSESNGLTQSELVKATHMKGSTVSVSITKLEKMGYVKRVENKYDLRSVRVYLTEKGRDLNDTMLRILNENDQLIMKGITPREIKITMSVLETMLNNLIESIK